MFTFQVPLPQKLCHIRGLELPVATSSTFGAVPAPLGVVVGPLVLDLYFHVPAPGVEPGTTVLSGRCSTGELEQGYEYRKRTVRDLNPRSPE